MPPALDRLLASPSALGLLRSVVNYTDAPTAYLGSTRCSNCIVLRRAYRPPRKKTPLVRFKDTPSPKSRDDVRQTNQRQAVQDQELPSIDIGIDLPDNATSWAEYLQRLERVEGLNGIRHVWEERRDFDLPVDDSPQAEFLWGTFIRVPDLVHSVISHAAALLTKGGKTYPHLYELCMGYWLRERHIERALDFHHQLVVRLKLRKLPLKLLAHIGKQHFTPKVYEAFMGIYRTSNERDLYDEVVPVLVSRNSVTMARRWHTLCIHRGDRPSPRVAEEPAIQSLAASVATQSDPEAQLLTTHVKSIEKREPKLNADLVQRLKGRDSAPVRFDDAFCARMFATRTFPPDAIIKGLAMVGINEIGPQAVRAMAARTTPISDLALMFEALRAAGIALQGSVFSLALEKFAQEKRWHLVRSMLESDQHPEVYDDRKLQKELLDFYLQQQDLKQAHRTLAILSFFHQDMSNEAWNLLLRAQAKDLDLGHLLQILQTMRSNGIYVNAETLMTIKKTLRPRRRGAKPGRSPRGRFDDLRFVARVFFTILEGGIGPILPAVWAEILRRYGMSNRFRELRRTVLRLFLWYAPRNSKQFASLSKLPYLDSVTEQLRTAPPHDWKFPYYDLPHFVTQKHRMHPLRVLFPPSFQQGLIVWGFRQGLLPNAPTEQSMLGQIPSKKHYRRRFVRGGILHRLDWSVGLRHLVELRDLGLDVHPHTVVKALQRMFVNLFGRGHSNVIENRKMERANNIPYAEYVHEVNRIWGKPLFREPQFYGRSRLHALMWHPRFERQVRRQQDFSLDEILGPRWRGQKDPDVDDEASRAEGVDAEADYSVLGSVLNTIEPHRVDQAGQDVEGSTPLASASAAHGASMHPSGSGLEELEKAAAAQHPPSIQRRSRR